MFKYGNIQSAYVEDTAQQACFGPAMQAVSLSQDTAGGVSQPASHIRLPGYRGLGTSRTGAWCGFADAAAQLQTPHALASGYTDYQKLMHKSAHCRLFTVEQKLPLQLYRWGAHTAFSPLIWKDKF